MLDSKIEFILMAKIVSQQSVYEIYKKVFDKN